MSPCPEFFIPKGVANQLELYALNEYHGYEQSPLGQAERRAIDGDNALLFACIEGPTTLARKNLMIRPDGTTHLRQSSLVHG